METKSAAIQKAFEMHPEVKTWKLDTILQEKGNCHLYEKCGFAPCGPIYLDEGNPHVPMCLQLPRRGE